VSKRIEDHHSHQFYKKRWSKYLWVEVLILLICPIPEVEFFVKFTYRTHDFEGKTVDVDCRQFFSDYLMCLMYLRLYFVVRACFNYSVYSDAFSRNICKNHDFYPGFRFILKSRLASAPETTVMIMFFGSVVVLSFMLRVFELRFAFNPALDTIALSEAKFIH